MGKGKSISKAMSKTEKKNNKMNGLARAGAAYGIFAASAYGVYNNTAVCEEAKPAAVESETVNYGWRVAPEYDAQTKFLKLGFAVLKDENKTNNKKEIKKAIAAIYEKAMPDLGRMFKGEMAKAVKKIKFDGKGGIEITLEYKPAADENTDKVRITYSLAIVKAPLDLEDVLAPETQEKATIIAWQKHNTKTKKWEDMPVPEKMQPMEKQAGKKKPECSYPRWNPQGYKYGFMKKSGLNKWFK